MEKIQTAFTKMSSKGQIVIPRDLRGDIKEGDKLLVVTDGKDIILKKSIPETVLLAEKSLAEEWLNPEEEEAWSYL